MRYSALLSILIIFYSFSLFSQTIELQEFASGIDSIITIANAGDERLFIVEQTGKIHIVKGNGEINETPFLDISNKVSTGSEQGLLGLAFHPNYSSNGFFFINYTNSSGNTFIEKYERSSSDPDIANPNSNTLILSFNQPFGNHNGGHIAFGPDGKLYIGSGDGGSGGDPGNRAQNINLLLGKLLRLDIDIPAPYIPSDNPFVGRNGADEIWAYGLRNPWKFSFDVENGDLWIGDVGQTGFEEVNKISSNVAGANYGWPCFEGTDDFDDRECSSNDLITPVIEYPRGGDQFFRCSVTGGYVYRGTKFPSLIGKYIFADYCSGELLVTENSGGPIVTTVTLTENSNFSTLGEDHENELYVSAYRRGIIYKIVDSEVLSNPDLEKESFQLTIKNPVEEELVIQNTNDIDEIIIFDLHGKELISEKNNAEKNIKITTDHLSNGIYLLWAENKKGEKTNLKFIKQ